MLHIILPMLLLLAASVATAGAPDTLTAKLPEADTLRLDPARHRLLWMETGITAPKGHLFIGIHEFVAARVGYGIFDFLQVDATGMFADNRLRAGAKVRVLPPIGPLQGVALHGEVGRMSIGGKNYAVMNGEIALSIAAGPASLHLNYAAEHVESEYMPAWSYRVQVGVSLDLKTDNPATKQALVIEAWFDTSPGARRSLETLAAAVRTSRKRFVWELGVGVSPPISVTGDGPGGRYPFPYLGLAWYI